MPHKSVAWRLVAMLSVGLVLAWGRPKGQALPPAVSPIKTAETAARSGLKPVYTTHFVQPGENPWTIAVSHGLPTASLLASNGLPGDAVLQPGQELLVPSQEGLLYTVADGDTLDAIGKRFKIPPKAVAEANPGLEPDILIPGQRLLLPGAQVLDPTEPAQGPVRIASAVQTADTPNSRPAPVSRGSTRVDPTPFPFWPVNGEVTTPYGWRIHPIYGTRSFHRGIDIAAPQGTPIRAVRPGKVVWAGWMGGYGYTVEIQHRDGMVTRYSHASKLLVAKEDIVPTGKVVALVGSTGVSTGPHLDFGVLVEGTAVNPMDWLR